MGLIHMTQMQYLEEVLFHNTFETESERNAFSTNSHTSFEDESTKSEGHRTVVKITMPSPLTSTVIISADFAIEQYQGNTITFECLCRASNVTEPGTYEGVKFRIKYELNGNDCFKNKQDVYGTFDWMQISNKLNVPDNATNGEIQLGMQGVSGTVWFDNITISRLVFVEPETDPSSFYRGHSLPRLRGVMASPSLEKDDVRVLGEEWNANAMRLKIQGFDGNDENMEEYYKWLNDQLESIDSVLKWCGEYGILVAIDMAYPIGGRIPYGETYQMRIYTNSSYEEAFINIWKNITRRYKDNEAVWAFDILNEPISGDVDDCLVLIEKTAREIRKIDTKTTILVSSCNWGGPDTYDEEMPYVLDITNLVYTVHIYTPHLFTHQGIKDIPIGPVYPGEINGQYWNITTLRNRIEGVRRFSVINSISIYVGEFSAIRWADGAAQYLSDCITLMEEYGWDYTYHAYKDYTGWNLEHSNEYGVTETVNTTDRKEVVLSWFSQNIHPGDIVDDDDNDEDIGGSFHFEISFLLLVFLFFQFF